MFLELADSIGLTQALSQNFSTEYETLLGIAAYMMAHGNVMMNYRDWADGIASLSIHSLSSQKLSELFSELKEENRAEFFKVWMKKAQEEEFIAYDVTSISSYSEEISYVEHGYNRDKENLAQINLGMFFGESSRIPLYYSVYPESIVDKSYLPFMMALTESMDMKKLHFVLDQGFMTQSNLELLVNKKHSALTLIPKNYKLYKNLLSKVVNQPFSARERLNGHEMYARSIETTYEGIPITVHFYFDPQKALLDEKAMFDDIQRQEETLNRLMKQKK